MANRVESLRRVVPAVGMFFGLGFGERGAPLSMRLGYRLEHWPGAIGTPLAMDARLSEGSRTDLSMDGIAFQATIAF